MQYVYVLLQTKINGRYLLLANLQRNIDITERFNRVTYTLDFISYLLLILTQEAHVSVRFSSYLLFLFFLSLSWLSIFSYFLRLFCFREFNILFFLVSIRINPVPRTASVPNPTIPYFQSPAPPDIGILNVAEFTTSKVQS